MIKNYLLIIWALIINMNLFAQEKEILIYHPIETDLNGKIIPWYDEDPGKSYDHVMNLVWNFWDTMRTDLNGLPYYMNHQVYNPNYNDIRGIGGDQLAMALSSWSLYYQYTGNERIKVNMFFMADYYLSHGFSAEDALWPNIPFPYNTLIYSGKYDGDMRSGVHVTQPDKAGSFGLELVHLYKMSSGYNVSENPLYLEAAVKIANTLASHTREGNLNYSPLPFKVNVYTGETVLFRNHSLTGTWTDTAGYTSNWAPAMQLFLELISMGKGNTTAYQKAFNTLLQWMKNYPMKANKWGPFFEDVGEWSDTQINAITFARFIMTHREYFPDWQQDVRKIIQWSQETFSNRKWKKYGVVVINEQTVFQVPANSHTARQSADELLYVSLTGDSTLYENAIRGLNWATYMVNFDGTNCFPTDAPWLTDGYGDFVRHFLRAMDADPRLAPPDQDHILSSTSTIHQADYEGQLTKLYGLNFGNVDSTQVKIFYRTYDKSGVERIRLTRKPSGILLDNQPLTECNTGQGYSWQALHAGGLLTIRREKGSETLILH